MNGQTLPPHAERGLSLPLADVPRTSAMHPRDAIRQKLAEPDPVEGLTKRVTALEDAVSALITQYDVLKAATEAQHNELLQQLAQQQTDRPFWQSKKLWTVLTGLVLTIATTYQADVDRRVTLAAIAAQVAAYIASQAGVDRAKEQAAAVKTEALARTAALRRE